MILHVFFKINAIYSYQYKIQFLYSLFFFIYIQLLTKFNFDFIINVQKVKIDEKIKKILTVNRDGVTINF